MEYQQAPGDQSEAEHGHWVTGTVLTTGVRGTLSLGLNTAQPDLPCTEMPEGQWLHSNRDGS